MDGSECYANTKVKSLETAFKFSYIAYDIVEEPAETQAENYIIVDLILQLGVCLHSEIRIASAKGDCRVKA